MNGPLGLEALLSTRPGPSHIVKSTNLRSAEQPLNLQLRLDFARRSVDLKLNGIDKHLRIQGKT